MKKNLVVFFVILQTICAASWADKGLIVTIDQETLSEKNNTIWDDHRADFIQSKAKNKYENVYIVRGDLVRDDEYMQFVWAEALENNEIVDYVSFVHGGRQWIKDEWNVPVDSKKLRMVYSEGCKGGSGLDEFVKKYGAFLSAGHNKTAVGVSASPFFSFVFLVSWLEGNSFSEALNDAWLTGTLALSDSGYFQIAQVMGGYNNVDEALEASRIQYAHRGDVDPNLFTLHCPRQELWNEGLELIQDTLPKEPTQGTNRLDVLIEIFNQEIL